MSKQLRRRHAAAEWNSFQHGAVTHERAFQRDLAIQARSNTDDMRYAAEAWSQFLPVLDAKFRIALEDTNMCSSAEQARLQCTLKTIINGECNNERRDAGRDSHKRNDRNNGNYGLF